MSVTKIETALNASARIFNAKIIKTVFMAEAIPLFQQ